MKESIFILLIVCVLAAFTAIRYRKQIAGMIGFARMLKDAKDSALQAGAPGVEPAGVPLVNCSKCGVWVPKNKSIKVGDLGFCSNTCLETSKTN